ncbi:MAG: hypothetical protein ABIN18_10165 [Pseudomonadota bacterium]
MTIEKENRVLKFYIKRIHAIVMAAKRDREQGKSPCNYQFCENDFDDIGQIANEAMSIVE